jgi:hypothetical protein
LSCATWAPSRPVSKSAGVSVYLFTINACAYIKNKYTLTQISCYLQYCISTYKLRSFNNAEHAAQVENALGKLCGDYDLTFSCALALGRLGYSWRLAEYLNPPSVCPAVLAAIGELGDGGKEYTSHLLIEARVEKRSCQCIFIHHKCFCIY